MVDAGRAPEDSHFMDAIDELGKTDEETGKVTPAPAITLEMLKFNASQELGEWFRVPTNRRRTPHRLEACGYIPVRRKQTDDGLWKMFKNRVAIYALKTLSADDRYKAAEALKAEADAKVADAKKKAKERADELVRQHAEEEKKRATRRAAHEEQAKARTKADAANLAAGKRRRPRSD